jgi:hypothetical protein
MLRPRGIAGARRPGAAIEVLFADHGLYTKVKELRACLDPSGSR